MGYLLLDAGQLPALSPFKCESAKSERRYRAAPKDFACRTAIKPVAPCRGDFCADIFSIFVLRPASRVQGSRSPSLFLLSALVVPAFFLSLTPPSPRILVLSSSVCQFISVSLFPSWHVLRHGQFRGHEVALHLSEKRARIAASTCISTTHAREIFETILGLNCLLQVSLAKFLILIVSSKTHRYACLYHIFFDLVPCDYFLISKKIAIKRKIFRLVLVDA